MKGKRNRKRLLSGLFALILAATLIQQYPALAQESKSMKQVSEEDKRDSVISFQNLRSELDDVQVILSINGEEQTITYPAGLIKDNLESISGYLEGNETFRTAVLRKADGTETEIARAGTYEGKTYYSLNDQQDTGIMLAEEDELVLICASLYQVTYTTAGNGTITGQETLWKGTGLEASVSAGKYYHIESVKWTEAAEDHSLAVTNEDSMQISIPAEEINSDITVTVEFGRDAPYTITAGQIQQGGICLNQGTEGDDYYPDGVDQPIPEVDPGETQTFMVFSQSWTGGKEYYLNMMRINGENVNVPSGYDVGESAETTLPNGSLVTIRLVQKHVGLYWKDGDPQYGPFGAFWWWNKERCLYEVTVTDIQEDLVINLNFKDGDNREMILTGLEGIETVGASSEDIWYKANLPYMGNHYDYDVQKNDGDTVYEAYYNDGPIDATAYNIYLYTVMPGYNPNTVSFEVSYNGESMLSEDAIMPVRDGSGNPAWMLTVDEMAQALDTNYRHFEDFIASARGLGYTHCFALNQNSAYNQILRLKANPYEYHMEFELNGGTYDGTGLDESRYETDAGTGIVTEKNPDGSLRIYTLENGSAAANMPLTEPLKEGYIFAGWQLYQGGEPVREELYSANELFVIDENSIIYAEGDAEKDEDHSFRFVAQWIDVAADTETAGYTVNYYRESPDGEYEKNGRRYTLYRTASESGAVGDTAVILNDNAPEGEYILNEEISVRAVTLIDERDEDYVEGQSNILELYYDRFEVPDSGIRGGSAAACAGIGAAGLAGLILLFLYRRKRNV